MGKVVKWLFRKYLIRQGARASLSLIEEANFAQLHGRDCIFIAAMPKSAGTFVSKALANYYGYPYSHISDRDGGCEFDIYRPSLIDAYKKNVIVHQHTLGTEGNIYYLNRYNIRPVVIVRNIYDVLVSFRDHMLIESTRWPFVSVDEHFLALEKQEQYNFIIQYVLPWLIHFYVSWYNVSVLNDDIPVLWRAYEEFTQDRRRFIRGIINWHDATGSVDDQLIDKALEKSGHSSRVNVGVSGRGAIELHEAQRRAVRGATKFYKHVDFSQIGL